jgi:hypothetical protein
VNSWRDELQEVIRTKAERDAEEQERHKKRIIEALEVADRAHVEAVEGLRFAATELEKKGQPASFEEQAGSCRLGLHGIDVVVELHRETAILRVRYKEGKPRDFDFATDRHLAPKDIEEYVGRRLVEMVRAAQKEHPW